MTSKVLLALLPVFLGASPSPPKEKAPVWHGDAAAALREARLSGRPVFAVFR